MAERLPVISSDVGTWGGVLNGYLGADHDATGFHTSRGRTFESFGGSLGGSIAAQAAAIVAMRAWWTANGGGVVTFGLGIYLNMGAIQFPVSGCTIEGQGMWATQLRVMPGLNADFITNLVAVNISGPNSTNAQFCCVRNLMIDGNKANNTSGRGIFFTTFPPANTAAAGDADFDSHHVLENLFIKNVEGTGVDQKGRSTNTMHNVHVYFADGRGFDLAYDSFQNACVAGASGLQGFVCNGSSGRLVNCASFYSGQITPSLGAGYMMQGTRNSGIHVSASTAQDNRASGWLLDTSSMTDLSSCSADSNCTSFANTLPGIDLFNSTYNHVQVICQDRLWNGVNQTQSFAIRVQSASIYNYIELTNYNANLGGTMVPVLLWDATSDANTVIINGSAGQQRIAYPGTGGTITPDPTHGGSMIIGTLTGATVTIAAPLLGNRWPGQKIRFTITQDATGGRIVTWNAIYHLASAAALPTTLSRTCNIEFEYDATAVIYRETTRAIAIV